MNSMQIQDNMTLEDDTPDETEDVIPDETALFPIQSILGSP